MGGACAAPSYDPKPRRANYPAPPRRRRSPEPEEAGAWRILRGLQVRRSRFCRTLGFSTFPILSLMLAAALHLEAEMDGRVRGHGQLATPGARSRDIASRSCVSFSWLCSARPPGSALSSVRLDVRVALDLGEGTGYSEIEVRSAMRIKALPRIFLHLHPIPNSIGRAIFQLQASWPLALCLCGSRSGDLRRCPALFSFSECSECCGST